MCGITGIVNWGNRQTLQAMTDIIAHRGPDDQGIWECDTKDGPYVGLGNRRLSIIDLSAAGHMPMSSSDGSLWITYNGEIYNFPQLRQELLDDGYKFRSQTDTEVILELYRREGPACLSKLNGMFALAIWDSREQTLFLARDHFGVKPLYYTQQGEKLAFGSEIKSILCLEDVPRKVDIEALHQYLTFLWVPDPKTLFRDIYQLPAGHYAIFKNGTLHVEEYWDFEFPDESKEFSRPIDDLVVETRERFLSSVSGQMISDVPVGAFLSSGIDSSSIVAGMSRHSSDPVSTYMITFPDNYLKGEIQLDDPKVARSFTDQLGCNHHELLVEPDVAELLPKLIWHLDEPIGASIALTTYLVCERARPSSTVMLSGVGGDELFAGYRKYIGHYLAKKYQKIPSVLRKSLIEPIVKSLPAMRGTSFKDYIRLAKKMANSGSLPPRDRFLMDGTYLNEFSKLHLYTDELRKVTEPYDPWIRHREFFDRVEHADFLNQMLYLDSKTFMISLNLTVTDKMSMASSVEVRVPFLDKDLAQFAASEIPPDQKLHGNTTKYIFKQAMDGILPPEVLNAKKAGFGAPLDYWLANDLRPMVDDLLSESRIKSRGYFNPAFVKGLIDDHRSGRNDWSLQIWQLLTLELWLQKFIDPESLALAAQ